MKRRLWVRIGIWVSIGLVALIIVAFTAGRPLLNKRARALVVKTLAHHADEKALEKLSVELDILQGDLVVHDLEVEPVPSATSQDKAVLSFSAPRLEFDVSLWRLLIGRLHLTSIRLDRPIIRIDDVAHVKHAEGFDIQHMVRKMRQGLSGYLSSVGISNLTVEQAKLIYRRTTAAGTWEFELNGLDLELAGLQIDEALLDTPERMALEELRIGLGAHEFTTPKGNIHARLDRLDISFARRSIDILGLRMEIAANTTKGSEPKGSPMRVSLDGFHMHGIDLHPASSSDTLVAERIILDRPMVTLELQNHAPHHGLDTTSRLASVLSEFVPQQRLDTLDIRNGSLHLTQEQGRSLGIEHINVHIVELHGSTALVGNGFDMRPPRAGNIHVSGVSAKQHGVALELGSLAFDLSEGDLKGVDLRCAFDGGQRTGREELEVARFGVIGMDLVAYLKDRSVSMDSLYILGSEVNMAVQAKAPAARKTDGAEEDIHLRLALDRLLEGTGSPILSIRNIEVQGEVKLRSADHGTLSGSLGRVAIHGTGFRFPEGKEEVHRLLYIDQLRVALNDLILDEQASGIRFTAGSVDARTGQHGIIVERPTIHMQGRRASDLSAGRIELIGLDYVALLERRGIFLDRILLDGADLEIDLPEHRPEADAKAPVASALLKHVHAKDIELRSRTLRLRKQGELLVQVDSFYYRCRDLRADPEAWTPTNMAFRRDALQYGGRRLRLAPPGSGITGSVKAFDIDMINDHALMTELDLLVNRPGLQATLRIPSISSSDFDPHFIDRTNVIALGRLVIHGPEIGLQLHEETPPTSADGTHRKPAAPSPYRGVHARSIALRNGTVELALDRGENSVEARIMDLNTLLADLNVQVDTTDQPLRTGPVTVEAGRIDVLSGDHADSTLTTLDLFMALNAATMDGTGNYVAEGLRFGAKQVSAPLPGGMHVTTGSLDYSPQEERLEVENIHYAPIASQAGFATDRPYRADAIVLDVDRVRISGIDVPNMITTKKYHVRSISMEGAHVNDLRDHRLPIAPYRYKPMLHRTIMDLEQSVRIDTVQVRGARVDYGEIQPVDTARIRLSSVFTHILNIRSRSAANGRPMTMHTTGLIQEQGAFSVSMEFDSDHPKDLFTYRFSLGPMDLSALDGMLAPAAHITIDQGMLDTLFLVAEANDDVAIGNMTMYFRKLHLRLLDRHNEYNGVFPVAESWVANSLIRNNHEPGRKAKPAAIYFERLKDRSIFNYVIKQSLSGAGGNIRLPDHKGKIRRLDDEELKLRLEQDTRNP